MATCHICRTHEATKCVDDVLLCPNCTRVFSSSVKNHFKFGPQSTLTVSFELETSSNVGVHYYLWTLRFLPTYDLTIDGTEWKSPIIYGRAAFATFIHSTFQYVTPNCIVSTHTHIGDTNRRLKNVLKKNPESYSFSDAWILKYINMETIEYVFGRRFSREYAYFFSPWDKYCWINTLHTETVEFRLCKFRSPEHAIILVNMLWDLKRILIQQFTDKRDPNGVAQTMAALIYKAAEEMQKEGISPLP